MVIEKLVARTEITQPRLTIRRGDEAVARTIAITGKQHVALAAVPRQRVELGTAEPLLFFRGDQLGHRRVPDIAQEMVRFNEMVTGIEIAIMFQCQGVATSRR